MNTRLSIWLAISTLIVTVLCSRVSYAEAQPAVAAAAYDNPTTYTITRKGKKIGTHELRIDKNGNDITVDVISKIRVTVLKIPVFQFDYSATEFWKDGALESVTSDVKENDKETSVKLQSAGGTSVLSSAGKEEKAARLNFTSNHWNPAVTSATRVFNTLTGKASDVTVEFIGNETIGSGIEAKHYRYSGDITADTWYDTTGKWVKLSFAGKDGSLIEYTINQ